MANPAGFLPNMLGPVVIKGDGVVLPSRPTLDFAGAYDDPDNDRTVIPGGGGGDLNSATFVWQVPDNTDTTPLPSEKVKLTTVDATPVAMWTVVQDDESFTDYALTLTGAGSGGQCYRVDFGAAWRKTAGVMTEIRPPTPIDEYGTLSAAFALDGQAPTLTVTGLAVDVLWNLTVTRQINKITYVAPVGFDRAALTLTAFVKAPYAASPWVGQASAGTSATHNFSEGTNPPAVGTGNSADFDGSNDLLGGAAFSAFASTTAFGGYVLVNIDAISSNAGSPGLYNNDTIWSNGIYAGLVLRDDGAGTKTVTLFAYHSGQESVSKPIATGSKTLVHFRMAGGNIQVGVNGSWAAPVACGAVDDISANLLLGMGYAPATNMNGKMYEFGMGATFSDGDLANVILGINADYGTAF